MMIAKSRLKRDENSFLLLFESETNLQRVTAQNSVECDLHFENV